MGKSQKPAILEDLNRFVEIGGYLSLPRPFSLNEIARKMRISTPTVSEILHRVSLHLGGIEIVHTQKGAKSATTLTAEGAIFLQRTRDFLRWRPSMAAEIRLGISHSLLTSQLLSPAIYEFQQKEKVRIRLQQSSVVMDFDQMVRGLQTDRLDLAIVWSTEERMKPSFPGVKRGEFNFPFDLVFISRKVEKLPDLKDLSSVAGMRLVTMRPEFLDLGEDRRIPPPNGAIGGERMTADTLDAVLASVLSGICDLGLVVANYSELDPYYYQRKIFYTGPLGQTKLLWFRRDDDDVSTGNMISFLNDYLENTPTQKSYELNARSHSFPTEKSFYSNFKFGYYVDHFRRESDYKAESMPRWHWEEICMRPDAEPTAAVSFHGYIRNSFGDTFTCKSKLEGQLFYVNASVGKHAIFTDSVNNFVSVFTWYQQTPDNTIMYGSWSGTDPIDKRPVLYGTFWSWKPLTLKKLRELAQTVRARTALDSEIGHKFEEHPSRCKLEMPESKWADDWAHADTTIDSRR